MFEKQGTLVIICPGNWNLEVPVIPAVRCRLAKSRLAVAAQIPCHGYVVSAERKIGFVDKFGWNLDAYMWETSLQLGLQDPGLSVES